VEETVSAHARRVLRTRLRTRIAATLDTGIAVLQRLRAKTGGAPEPAEDPDDRRGSRPDRLQTRPGASAAPAATPAEAPKPKRRLRALLIPSGVLLVGGIGGSALAYTLFQQQLDRVLNDSLRQEAAHAKKNRPSAEIQQAFDDEQARRADAEKKLAASLAVYSAASSEAQRQLESLLAEQLMANRHLQASLADAARSNTEARNMLAAEQAKRTGAEAKLAGSTQALSEKQRQLDRAEKQLTVLQVGTSTGIQRETLASRTSSRETSRASRTGDCTLNTRNVEGLKGCIADFNR